METIQGRLVTDNLWVVEFSISQKAFHLSTMTEMVKNNILNVMERTQSDYVAIGVFNNTEDADTYIQRCYDDIKNYSLFRSWDKQTIVL